MGCYTDTNQQQPILTMQPQLGILSAPPGWSHTCQPHSHLNAWGIHTPALQDLRSSPPPTKLKEYPSLLFAGVQLQPNSELRKGAWSRQ